MRRSIRFASVWPIVGRPIPRVDLGGRIWGRLDEFWGRSIKETTSPREWPFLFLSSWWVQQVSHLHFLWVFNFFYSHFLFRFGAHFLLWKKRIKEKYESAHPPTLAQKSSEEVNLSELITKFREQKKLREGKNYQWMRKDEKTINKKKSEEGETETKKNTRLQGDFVFSPKFPPIFRDSWIDLETVHEIIHCVRYNTKLQCQLPLKVLNNRIVTSFPLFSLLSVSVSLSLLLGVPSYSFHLRQCRQLPLFGMWKSDVWRSCRSNHEIDNVNNTPSTERKERVKSEMKNEKR